MNKFRQILMELSARGTPIWILTKLGTCIDMKKIWFGIAYGQILSMFGRVICPGHDNGRVLQFNVFIYLYWDLK